MGGLIGKTTFITRKENTSITDCNDFKADFDFQFVRNALNVPENTITCGILCMKLTSSGFYNQLCFLPNGKIYTRHFDNSEYHKSWFDWQLLSLS